jgi:hypothetical protein
LDELGHVDIVQREAPNFGDELREWSQRDYQRGNKVYLHGRRCGGQRQLRRQ